MIDWSKVNLVRSEYLKVSRRALRFNIINSWCRVNIIEHSKIEITEITSQVRLRVSESLSPHGRIQQ